MIKVFLLIFLSGLTITRALQLPPEPKYPNSVCAEINAALKESPVGYLPADDESKLDTNRIQQGLDNCGSGNALKLVKGDGNAFLSGPLVIPSEVTLWIDEGVTLFASRNPRDFDRESYSCGVLADNSDGCFPLIRVRDARNTAIVGEGVIDGRGGQKMIGSDETWWELSIRAEREISNQSCPRLIVVEKSQDFVLYRIRLHNSPYYHFVTEDVVGLLVWGVRVETPTAAYPDGLRARNTDGFDPNGRDMVITQCYIKAGDDSIAIKGQHYPVANVLIQDNHFYKGHGMSIGSEINQGAVNVSVINLSIQDAECGIRIKSDASRGGHVRDIYYENICIRNTDVPLIFDTYYTNKDDSKIPKFDNIHVKDVHILSSRNKTVVFRGYNQATPVSISLDNVVSDIELTDLLALNAKITLGPGDVSGIPLETEIQENVEILDHRVKSTPVDCSSMFVPFPR